MGAPSSGKTATRALVSITATPDRQFQLTPPSLLTGDTGYRPRINLVPSLSLGGAPASASAGALPPYVPSSGGASTSGARAEPDPSASSAAAQPSGWQVLAQAVAQINYANWSFTRGATAPLAATTLQFNLLFSGFGNKFQVGEYLSGSGTFNSDALGRVYSLSWGVLLGGNDLLVRGPLSFINPQLQAGLNFTNLGRPDASPQFAANLSNFVNVSAQGSALTVGVGGQVGYAYDFAANMSAFSASLLLQFQLQKSLGSP